jgi:prevent-host-death family protein
VKHVTKLVERAEHGEDVVITRHGKAVAKLIAVERAKEKRRFGTLKGLGRVIDPQRFQIRETSPEVVRAVSATEFRRREV